MASKLKVYSKLRKKYLEDYPNCMIYPHLKSTDIHHMRGRIGDLLCDTSWWMALSREAHSWIHDNPKEAREKGYLK